MPTVKQHLAAIRMLFDYLVTGLATSQPWCLEIQREFTETTG